MIEHLTIQVDDLDAATRFYEMLLAPLGYAVTRRPRQRDDRPRVAFGRDRRASLWLVEGTAHEGLTIAVTATDGDAVQAFRASAAAARAGAVGEIAVADGRTSASAGDPAGNRIVAVAGGSGRGMIDHVVLPVSDLARSLRFHETLLAPLEVTTTARDLAAADGARVGLGQGGTTSLWLTEGGEPQSGVAIGVSAATRRQVDEFHADAIDFGARAIAAPAVRTVVGPDYYVAGATDPDGNRIEAVRDGELGLAPVAPVEPFDDGGALAERDAERHRDIFAAEPARRSPPGGSALDVDFSIVAKPPGSS